MVLWVGEEGDCLQANLLCVLVIVIGIGREEEHANGVNDVLW